MRKLTFYANYTIRSFNNCSQNVATIFYSPHLSVSEFPIQNKFHLVVYTAFFVNITLLYFPMYKCFPSSRTSFPCSESFFVARYTDAMDRSVFAAICFWLSLLSSVKSWIICFSKTSFKTSFWCFGISTFFLSHIIIL